MSINLLPLCALCSVLFIHAARDKLRSELR